mmetsp:Transcript_124280/g.397868  ORF Transcript_124280/g.397868 Transcript_124280/m.397868 type:complete len:131 (-) Transcript_124280:8-400(-)
MGKRFKTPVRPDRCRTEATQVGMGGCQAHDMNKVGVPLHDFEALRPVGADRPFRHHEDYSGHIPVSARNQNHYGKTFGMPPPPGSTSDVGPSHSASSHSRGRGRGRDRTESNDWKMLTARAFSRSQLCRV